MWDVMFTRGYINMDEIYIIEIKNTRNMWGV